MANVMHNTDNVSAAMDMLLTMLDLVSDAVYATRKYMEYPDEVTFGHMASAAISELLARSEDITDAIYELLPEPPINLNLPKKAR